VELTIASLIEGDALWKLLFAIVLGGIVGLEREWHGRAAGLRTHVLVCLGATILIIAARGASEAFAASVSEGRMVLDPNRIAAGIVTGIGFLGAGAILRTGDLVRGLTTAACIWFVAALGIVIGNGLYSLGTFATLLMVLMLIVFDALEHHIPAVMYRSLYLRTSITDADQVEEWCTQVLRGSHTRILEIVRGRDHDADAASIIYRLRVRGQLASDRIIREAAHRPGVRVVQWEQDSFRSILPQGSR